MKVIIKSSEHDCAQEAFSLFQNAYQNGAKHFGLATGTTPLGLYELIRNSNMDFSDCISINLDEYVGLSRDNAHSYHHYMKEQLFAVKPFKHSFLPNGLATDEQGEIDAYEQLLSTYPIDFQILGLGSNAHIGFNEPGTPFTQTTHKVKLADATIRANSRFFENEQEVPQYAFSMGLASIMKAKEIVLLAFGRNKAQAVADLVQGPVTVDVPASILQTHPNVTIIIDEQAASLLH